MSPAASALMLPQAAPAGKRNCRGCMARAGCSRKKIGAPPGRFLSFCWTSMPVKGINLYVTRRTCCFGWAHTSAEPQAVSTPSWGSCFIHGFVRCIPDVAGLPPPASRVAANRAVAQVSLHLGAARFIGAGSPFTADRRRRYHEARFAAREPAGQRHYLLLKESFDDARPHDPS